MHAASRRAAAIIRAAGVSAKSLSLSDLERRALWAGASGRRKKRSA